MKANYQIVDGGTILDLTFSQEQRGFQNNQMWLICRTSLGAITINLPKISDLGSGLEYKIIIDDIDDDALANNITINCDVANTIENAASYVISKDGGKCQIYVSNKLEWGVLTLGAASGINNLESPISQTYAQILAKITANTLIAGQKYLITDFAQSYNIFDGGTMAIEEEQVGVLEPIIVTAATSSTLQIEAISTLFPNDEILYSPTILDIRDIGYGNGVDTVNANFKGQIYYRKDTIQNVETHYDFHNIKFRRWAVNAVAFDNGAAYIAKDVCKASDGKIYKCITATTGEGDPTVNTTDWVLWLDITADAFVSWTSDKTLFNIGDITTDNLIINNVTAGVDYDDFYTFGDYYNWVHDVSIGGINLDLLIDNYGSATILLSQKVFKTTDDLYTCYSIKFGDNNLPMTFGNGNRSMTFANGNSSMIFGGGNRSMTFANGNSSMTFGGLNSSMTFGGDNRSMTFGNVNFSMTFGGGNRSMTFANGNSSMTFGGGNRSMTFANGNSSMTFGGGNFSMTFGNGNSSMIFGYASNNTDKIITFGDNNIMCVFKDKCFKGLAADLDLTTANHIRAAYNTTIYQDKTLGVRLSYYDNDVLTYAAVTA